MTEILHPERHVHFNEPLTPLQRLSVRTPGRPSIDQIPKRCSLSFLNRDYYYDDVGRTTRWGEDDVSASQYNAKNGMAKFRNNLDCCHTLHGVCPTCKYNEGYIPFCKNMEWNTKRRVPRDPTYAVFPVNDSERTDSFGQHELLPGTRKTIADIQHRLYCSTRNSAIYQDLTQEIKDQFDRNLLYEKYIGRPGPVYQRQKIENHPLPKMSNYKGIHTVTSMGEHYRYRDDPRYPWKAINPVGAAIGEVNVKDAKIDPNISTHVTSSEGNAEAEIRDGNVYVGLAEGQAVTGAEKEEDKSKSPQEEDQEETEKNNADEEFGPWMNSAPVKDWQSAYLLPYVYNYRLPSALHSEPKQLNYMNKFHDVASQGLNGVQHESGQQTTLGNAPQQNPQLQSCQQTPPTYAQLNVPCQPQSPLLLHKTLSERDPLSTPFQAETIENILKAKDMPEYIDQIRLLAGKPPYNLTFPNACSKRTIPPALRVNYDNIRLPSISTKLGHYEKSEANKRHHQEYPDIVPDLRTFKKYTKRVCFYGYNSDVFR